MEILLNIYLIATSLVTVASAICNYTDTPKGNDWKAKAYGVVEKFALLGNKAKK